MVLKLGADHAEELDMSDRARFLDDVHRSSPPAAPSAWSPGTAALAEVLSNWIPGPAPVAEPELEVVDEVEVRPEPLAPEAELRAPTARRAGLVWSIADDDILPPRRARRLRLRLRRR